MEDSVPGPSSQTRNYSERDRYANLSPLERQAAMYPVSYFLSQNRPETNDEEIQEIQEMEETVPKVEMDKRRKPSTQEINGSKVRSSSVPNRRSIDNRRSMDNHQDENEEPRRVREPAAPRPRISAPKPRPLQPDDGMDDIGFQSIDRSNNDRDMIATQAERIEHIKRRLHGMYRQPVNFMLQ